MTQPVLNAPTTVTTGFGSAVVGYGYAMTGTTITACTQNAANLLVTSTTVFKGA
jgi:hypothetical protein